MAIHAGAKIHAMAVVEAGAVIGDGVEIGPFSVIGANVVIGANTWVGPHVVIQGHTTIGANNKIFQYSSLGAVPQDKKYAGEPTQLIIGDNNVIREFCTFNLGTIQDGGLTRLGNGNWIMAYVHLSHDCMVGDNTIFANGASLAGHVTIGNGVILGGFTMVRQFCRIGDYAMTAFSTGVNQDVPPYVMAAGYQGAPAGINSEGMKRRGSSPEAIRQVKNVYKILFRQGLPLAEAKAQVLALAQAGDKPELLPFIDFFEKSTESIIR